MAEKTHAAYYFGHTEADRAFVWYIASADPSDRSDISFGSGAVSDHAGEDRDCDERTDQTDMAAASHFSSAFL